MTDKEKIRAEIERLKKTSLKCGAIGKNSRIVVLNEILSFIDSLQEEPVSYDLVKFADCASVDYRKQRESCGLKDPITLDEVEEANYSGIMAGAQWQKSKLPKWKKFSSNGCWSGEIGAKPTIRKYIYEHYAINADKLFKLLDKED